jgi:hypothetical protein
MIQVGQKYALGDVEHVFPPLTLSGKFKYTSKVKDAHKRLLLLLDDFDTLCELQDIEYTIGGVTLLGAVRHGGFVPWEPNAEVEMLETDAIQLEKIYAQPSDWILKKVGYGYRIHKKNESSPYLDVLLTTYSKILHKYVFMDERRREEFPLYESLYAELHPRRRYTYENIMLWGPQYGEELCQRRYGVECLSVAVVGGGEGWQMKLLKVLKLIQRLLMLERK